MSFVASAALLSSGCAGAPPDAHHGAAAPAHETASSAFAYSKPKTFLRPELGPKPPDPERVRRDRGIRLYGEGVLALERKDAEEAIERFKEAGKLIDAPTIELQLARAYELAKRNDDAIRLYRRYLESDPDDKLEVMKHLQDMGVSAGTCVQPPCLPGDFMP